MMYDKLTGDVYIGEYTDGKRVGHGRMLSNKKMEIYDGDWSNDRKQGEGVIVNGRGEILSGDFRADNMEGKLTYQRTLSKEETNRVFAAMRSQNDHFIAVTKTEGPLKGILTQAEKSKTRFESLRKTVTR